MLTWRWLTNVKPFKHLTIQQIDFDFKHQSSTLIYLDNFIKTLLYCDLHCTLTVYMNLENLSDYGRHRLLFVIFIIKGQ